MASSKYPKYFAQFDDKEPMIKAAALIDSIQAVHYFFKNKSMAESADLPLLQPL